MPQRVWCQAVGRFLAGSPEAEEVREGSGLHTSQSLPGRRAGRSP